MGKKQVNVSLRKPPPADPDEFVAGSDNAAASLAPRCEHASEGPTIVTRAGERREVTLYLPVALARQLSVRCVELDCDMSRLVAEALVKTLSMDPVPPIASSEAPAALPAPAAALPAPAAWSRARELFARVRARMPLAFGQAE
jgi:hypothetical protein